MATNYDIGYDMLFAVDAIMQENGKPEELGATFWKAFTPFVEKYNLAEIATAEFAVKEITNVG